MTTKVYVRKSGEAVIPARILKLWGMRPGTEFEINIHKPSYHKPTRFTHEIPPDKTVQDILDEFEQKYQMNSDIFYELWQKGLSEDTPELNDWALFYSLKLSLEEKGEDSSKATFKPVKPKKIHA